jgi:hypothetical protein
MAVFRPGFREVVLLSGSILIRTGCTTDSSTVRSTRRIVNGTSRCTRARPRSSNSRARFSEHGISGRFRLSRTNTAKFDTSLDLLPRLKAVDSRLAREVALRATPPLFYHRFSLIKQRAPYIPSLKCRALRRFFSVTGPGFGNGAGFLPPRPLGWEDTGFGDEVWGRVPGGLNQRLLVCRLFLPELHFVPFGEP